MVSDELAQDGGDREGRRQFSIVSVFIAGLFLVGVALITWYRWHCRGIGIDTAVWGQLLHIHLTEGVWEYTSYIDQAGTAARTIWGTHFNLTLIPLAWLYQLVPHVLILYVLQHLAYVGGALLVGVLAFEISGGDRWVGWLIMLTFLLYPPLIRSQIGFDYSSRHFTMLFLPLALLAFRHGWHSITLLVLGLCTAGIENLGLLAGFFCFVVAWECPEKRWVYLLAGVTLTLYPFLVIRWGLPLFRPADSAAHMVLRYQHLWAEGGMSALLASICSLESARYLLALLAPLAFIPLLCPSRWWLLMIPFLAQNLLSPWPETRLIGHHYTSPLAVAMFLCVLPALAWPHRRFIALGLLAFCLYSGSATNAVVAPVSLILAADLSEMEKVFSEIERHIPERVSLSAPHNLAAHLCQRRQLWFFPQGAREADVVIVPKMPLTFPDVPVASSAVLASELLSSGKARVVGENLFYQVLRRVDASPGSSSSVPLEGAP